MVRRSPYDVMAEIQKELLNDPSASTNRLSKRVGVDWLSVNKALKALDRNGLFNYKKK